MNADTLRIAVPGWSSGAPDYEANTSMTPGEKTGVGGYPRWYDEIIQQWPRARARYSEGRAEVSSMGVRLVRLGATQDDPDGNETPEEAAFNDALQDMITSRCGVLQGDGPAWGIGEVLSWAYDVPWFGFACADPYWHDDGDGDPLRNGRICLVPLLRAAVYRWNVDLVTGAVRSLWYMQALGTREIPYGEIIHLTHGGAPGQYFGDGELRPLIGIFSAWREAIRSGADGMRAAKGRLIIGEPEGLDSSGKARIQSLISGFDNGRVDSFSVPYGAEREITFPGGSMPDFAAWMQSLDLYCDQLFQSRTSSLGITESGSRATAEVLSDEDARAQSSAWDRIVDRMVQRVGGWVAKQVGYRGRIRRGECERAQASESPDALVDRVIKVRESMGGWSRADADKLREVVGWQSLEAAGIAEAAQAETTGLMVGQVQAAVEIMGNPTLTPAVKRELLIAAGVAAESADRMTMGANALPAQPPASAPAPTSPLGLIAQLAEHPHGCACGRHGAALAESYTWAGRDGVEITRWREPLAVDVDGVTYRPELSVAWGEVDEVRAEVDAALAVALAPIVDDHRAATWDALRKGGYKQPEQDAIYAEYRKRYEDTIVAYYDEARAAAVRQAQEERAAGDVRDTARDGLDVSALEEWAASQAERARLQARISAETIASRVQTPVQSAYASGVPRENFNPRQTLTGLASEAAPIAARLEAVGSLVDAAEAAPAGQVVVAAVRTSMRDPDVCDHCYAEDGKSWRFPEDKAEFLEYMDAHGLPDPECEGAPNCRCRITLIWGKK